MAALSLRFSWRRHVQPFFSFPPPPPILLLLQQQQQRLRRLRTSALPPPPHHHHQVLLYDNNHHTIFMNIASSSSSSSSSSFSPSPQDFVFLSVGLLLMYWVSNFVVPDLLMKNLFEEEEEEKEEEEVKQPVDVERDVFYEGLTGGGEGSNPDLAAGILNSNTKLGKSVNTGFGKDSKKEQKGRKRTKSNAPPN